VLFSFSDSFYNILMPKKKGKKSKKYLSWMNPKSVVRGTGKYGKGVFAGEDIKKRGEIKGLQLILEVKVNYVDEHIFS
jgi:hypothetical protein